MSYNSTIKIIVLFDAEIQPRIELSLKARKHTSPYIIYILHYTTDPLSVPIPNPELHTPY